MTRLFVPMLLAFAALILIWGSAARRSSVDAVASDDTPLPEVSITLLQPAKTVTATGLPADQLAAFLRSGNLLRPHVLKIRFPDGKAISLVARSMSWRMDQGIVVSVYVRRPLEPVGFQQAVADLHETVRGIGCEPNDVMKRMTGWGDVPGNEHADIMPYSNNAGRVIPSEKVNLNVTVSTDPKRGWYYLMLFGVDADEMPSSKMLRGRKSTSTQPAANPTSGPSTSSAVADNVP